MLFRKMLRDMKLNKTQFISIFLMSVISMFIFAGIGGEWYGLQTTVNSYYEETNLANIWILGKGFSKEAADKVLKVDGVTGVQRRLSIDSTADFKNKPDLKLYFIEKDEISKCKVIEGQSFSIDKDGIWLDSQFAKAKGLKVGDSISVSAKGITIKKEILGTVINPEYIYSTRNNDMIPNHENYGFAYLSYKAFPTDIKIFYTELVVTTDTTSYLEMENKINTALEGHYNVFLTRDNFESYAVFSEEINQHKAMGKIFPVAFLAIAMLTILTTMTRIVNNQRTQIGTLKSVGIKKSKILFHYISFGLWISLLGSAVGTLLGPFTLPYLFFSSLQTTYTLPQWKAEISASIFVMAILSVVACTLITYLACKNVLKDTPAQALRPKAPKVLKRKFFEDSKLWAKLGYNMQWNLRDISRSKVRSIMTIVGVVGCTALLICAFGMKDSLDDIIKWQYSELNQYNTKCMLSENLTEDRITALKKDISGEAIMEGNVEVKANGIKKTGALLVTDNVTLIQMENSEREVISLPKEEVAISYKLASILDVNEGDEIAWHIYGDEKWVTSKIGKINRTPISQGISMSREVFEKINYRFVPTALVTSEKLTGNISGIQSVLSKEELTENYKILTEAMGVMVYVLIFAAAILAVVVLYNLGILSFTELQRELATLKVIGFKTKKIRNLLLNQAIWLSVVGIAIGIPCGKWLISYMISLMGDTFDMMTIVSLPSFLYSVLGTLALSICVNLLFSGKIRKIDMVSSLKAVE